MTEVPKIVVARLGAAELAQRTHPDADLLTAFAEQALAPAEREAVLAHLALCQNCREVLALALPPVESVAPAAAADVDLVHSTPTTAKSGKNWLAALGWPSLRWAALAAGVIVGGSLLLSRHGDAPRLTPANPQVAVTTPPAPIPQTVPPTDQVAASPRTDVPQVRPEPALPNQINAGRAPSRPAPAESGILMADNKIAGKKEDSLRRGKPLSAAAPGARALDSSAPAQLAMARDEAPAIEKAKPALPEPDVDAHQVDAQQKDRAAALSNMARANAAGAAETLKPENFAKQILAPNFSFKIAAGFLQRSADGGRTWQTGLRANRSLLCYAAAEPDVWAGGEAGALFHSTDGGATWKQVQPAAQSQSLSADIVSIQVRGPVVALSTSNSETWSSTDAGQTWEKK